MCAYFQKKHDYLGSWRDVMVDKGTAALARDTALISSLRMVAPNYSGLQFQEI